MNLESLILFLESPQGSALYTLLILLTLSIASLVLQNRAKPEKLDRRVSIGLGVLMGLRLIELPLIISALDEPEALHLMPALERGIHLVSIVIITWLWSRFSAEPRGRQALFTAELAAAALGALVLLSMWGQIVPGTPFNYSNLDYAWSMAVLVVLIVGAGQILSSAAGKRTGLLHLGLLFLGQGLHIFLAEPFGSMPFLVEAANLMALVTLLTLPVQEPEEKQAPNQGEVEIPATLTPAFFDLEELSPSGEAKGPLQPAEELAKNLAEELDADLCLFATVNEAQVQLELEYGYNLLRSSAVEVTRIPLREVPRLTSALLRGRTLRLSAEQRLAELSTLSHALRLSFTSNLLASPFTHPRDLRRWAVLLVNVGREWKLGDEVALERVAAELGGRLARAMGISDEPIADAATPVKEELIETQSELNKLEAENERYRADVERLLAHIDQLQSAQEVTPAEERGEIVAALQKENENLRSAIASLEASGRTQPEPNKAVQQAKEELRLALQEVASLHARLDTAQQAMLEAGVQPGADGKVSAQQVELIASIAQELRQPLSSVLGYTDLLLSESVGILGALQRKFLERVRNSTGRMNSLIDDLIRIAELDQSGAAIMRKPVDLNSVFDDAIGLLRAQLQEKRIALRVDLPRQMPQLNTDRDALQQILYHLLQNADAATPAEGAITLRAIVDQQTEFGEFVLIQVSDSGGGIPEEDLPRVFSRVYRATNPVIKGVGDTGVGLTIAETLTQALGGRIWVESEANVGATFSVLLPLQQTPLPSGNI